MNTSTPVYWRITVRFLCAPYQLHKTTLDILLGLAMTLDLCDESCRRFEDEARGPRGPGFAAEGAAAFKRDCKTLYSVLEDSLEVIDPDLGVALPVLSSSRVDEQDRGAA